MLRGYENTYSVMANGNIASIAPSISGKNGLIRSLEPH
jgi:hypothetical protein